MHSEAACSETDKPLAATLARFEELARNCGFSHTGTFAIDSIRIYTEVRDSCASDKCGSYGKNWSCPPACGTLEECEKRIRQYSRGLILQTSGALEDTLDYEMMERIGAEHHRHLVDFQKGLKTLSSAGEAGMALASACLLLGSGPCKNCASCTYPGSPCPFPGQMIISMEAMGMLVSEVCTAGNLPYYYGPNTITYVGCVLA